MYKFQDVSFELRLNVVSDVDENYRSHVDDISCYLNRFCYFKDKTCQNELFNEFIGLSVVNQSFR
jgi:hypothetical protein